MKKILICGTTGFIGSNLVKKLKKEKKCWIRGVDIKEDDFNIKTCIDDFIVGDLRKPDDCKKIFTISFDEVYQLAADMGGAEYIFTNEHDADIMHNSLLINLNVLHYSRKINVKKIFYSSSACVYPKYNQLSADKPNCKEENTYPADPDSNYGWEKLTSERLYLAYRENYKMNIRIGRLHNVYGPYSVWDGGREKAPAAICRKVIENNEEIKIYGTGEQTRSFIYIDDCLDGILKLMESEFKDPINIGSEEMVTINKLAEYIIKISKKNIKITHVEGPLGVNGRNSDNKLIKEILNWEPKIKLEKGLEKTYEWIKEQIEN